MVGFYLILLDQFLNFNLCGSEYSGYPSTIHADITYIWIHKKNYDRSNYENMNLDPNSDLDLSIVTTLIRKIAITFKLCLRATTNYRIILVLG